MTTAINPYAAPITPSVAPSEPPKNEEILLDLSRSTSHQRFATGAVLSLGLNLALYGLVATIIGAAIWGLVIGMLYSDAWDNGVGRRPAGGIASSSPGTWALGMWLFGAVVIPLYAFHRGRARTAHESNWKFAIGFGLFLLIAAFQLLAIGIAVAA